ncbi:MAG: response regulator, partial [Proteobacteria bacterium]|nr:response regulator [Pseudomonadota bacterium]
FVSTALGSSRGLMTILNDILDLSIIESGKMEFQMEEFEVPSFVDDAVKVFRHQAEIKGIALKSYVHPGTPRWVVGDRGRLRQVLFNLVGNAAKFTPKGEVRVEVYPLPTVEKNRPRLLFSVQDTGIGIAEENLDRVFESFTQVDGSFTRDFQGTGLGLGIVKRLIELMDGHVEIGSQYGVGTMVHVCLPLGAVANSSKHEGESLMIRRFSPKTRVLVVEDSRANLIMVRRFLEKLGIEVESAENGREALDTLARSAPFDCILMDIQMPVMDGMETTRRIRTGENGATDSGVPIVALTAHAMKGDREMFLGAGMDSYLSKPVEIVDLANLLSTVLSSDRADEGHPLP